MNAFKVESLKVVEFRISQENVVETKVSFVGVPVARGSGSDFELLL